MNQPWLTMSDWPQRVRRCGSKEYGGLAHILGGRKLAIDRLAQHHVADDLVLRDSECSRLLGNLLLHERRPHEAGADDVRAHPVLGAFLRYDFAEPDQSVLRGDVGRLEKRRLFGMDRTDIDDRSASRPVHVPEAGLGRQEGAVQVDCEHLLPFRERELVDRLDDLDAGITDENIQPGEAFDRASDSDLDGGLVANIHRDSHRDAAVSLDFGGRRFRRGHLEVGNYDLCALAGETFGDLLADAARSTGDNCYLTVETSHGVKVLSTGRRIAGSNGFSPRAR